MLTKEEIIKRLEDRQLNLVAQRIGVHSNTLYNLIRNGSASYSTMTKLSNYLEDQCKVVADEKP